MHSACNAPRGTPSSQVFIKFTSLANSQDVLGCVKRQTNKETNSNEASIVLAWLQDLRQAAEAAVLLTHPSDSVADAAAVLAAAIAWCCR